MKNLQILILVFGLVVFTNAQNAILSGTIYDQSGAVIPNAEVILKSKRGKIYTSRTNEEGIYEFEVLEGLYSIEIKKNSFKIFKIKNYFVSPSFKGKMIFDVTLIVTGEVSDRNGFF